MSYNHRRICLAGIVHLIYARWNGHFVAKYIILYKLDDMFTGAKSRGRVSNLDLSTTDHDAGDGVDIKHDICRHWLNTTSIASSRTVLDVIPGRKYLQVARS